SAERSSHPSGTPPRSSSSHSPQQRLRSWHYFGSGGARPADQNRSAGRHSRRRPHRACASPVDRCRPWPLLKSRHVLRYASVVAETAYLSLGSNLGDRAANLRAALAQLGVAGRLLAVSALYETQPVDVPDQPRFLNCVAAIETDKTPRELLQLALRVEGAM